MAIHLASGAIFYSPAPAKPGYEVAVKEEKAGHGEAAKAAEVPIETLLASASVEHGAQVAKQCGACHNFQEGQGPKVGPDLYGVVGRQIASKPGFNYSAALKAKGSGTWTFDELDKWLKDPRADVPGTAMTFAGLSNEKQRADVIVYLNSLSRVRCRCPPRRRKASSEKKWRKPSRTLLFGTSRFCLRQRRGVFRRPHADVKRISSRHGSMPSAADLKFLTASGKLGRQLRIRKPHENHKFASVVLFSKFAQSVRLTVGKLQNEGHWRRSQKAHNQRPWS